jgi:hypothetical protein
MNFVLPAGLLVLADVVVAMQVSHPLCPNTLAYPTYLENFCARVF